MSDENDKTPAAERPPDLVGTHPRVDPDSLKSTPPGTFEGEAFEDTSEPAPRELPPVGDDGGDLLPERREPAGAPAMAIPAETQHTPRFQFLLGALLAVGGVALAVAVAIALRPAPVVIDPAAGWSPWRPAGTNAIEQISKHVGREYRLPSGRQLALVTGGPMAFLGLPAQVVLEQRPEQGGDFSLLKGDGIIYRLCGGGANCSISEGKPSVERTFLLRREALELALYTFRYVDGVDQVVVFLPPAPGKKGLTSLFRRDRLDAQLVRPLRASLAGRTPSVKGVESSPDASLVERLTKVLYTPSLSQANADAGLFLVLKPFDPGDTSSQSQDSGSGSDATSDPSQALQLPSP